MKRKNNNEGKDVRLSPALQGDMDMLIGKRRKRARSDSSEEFPVRLTRSSSNEPFASEFDEMWNDDAVNGDDSTLVEMKTSPEDKKATYSSLRSFLNRNQPAYCRHPEGRKAPPPTPDHVLMPPPLMRTKLRTSINMLNASPRGGDMDNSRALKRRSSSPTMLRAPPPSPQAYNTKVAFIRPPMPPSPILRSPMYHQSSSPLHPTMKDCPAKAMYSLTGTSPQFGPTRQTTRSPPPLALQVSQSPATFLSQKMNAHHLTQRAVRQSTTAVLQHVVANITVMKAAEISGLDEEEMDQEDC